MSVPENNIYKTKFYRTLIKMASVELEKNFLDEKSRDYIREKGNYEYAIRCLCRYLMQNGFNMDTYIIYRVTDFQLREFLKLQIHESDSDVKKSVLVGKMAVILNNLLAKDVDIMHLWPPKEVRCSCNAECHLIEAKWAYSCDAAKEGNLKGRYYYRCPVCGSMVGTHIGTNIPLGIPVNKKTAEKRVEAHNKINQIMSKRTMERTDVYTYLSKKLPNIDQSLIHFGNFDFKTCSKAISLLDTIEKDNSILSNVG